MKIMNIKSQIHNVNIFTLRLTATTKILATTTPYACESAISVPDVLKPSWKAPYGIKNKTMEVTIPSTILQANTFLLNSSFRKPGAYSLG